MQRILMAFAIVLLLAGLAFADTVTWTAAVNTDFTNVGNWTGGVPAADGDTIDSTTSTAPTGVNRPAAGTFHFSITNAVTVAISNFLNGAAIENVTVDNAGATVYCVSAITGNVVVTNGLFYPTNITISGTTDIAVAGTLQQYFGNTTAVGEVTLAGTLSLVGYFLDCSVPLRVTASTAAVDWGTTGDILGGFNAAGYTVAHTNTGAGSTLTCDVAGTLDLGGTATGVPINVTAATTASGTWTAGTVTATAGAITLADGANITANFVGAGGTVALAANATATITGNVTQGAVADKLITVAAGQNLTVTGTTTGGSAGGADGAWVTGGVATFNAVVGGSNGNARGVKATAGTTTITTVTGGAGFGLWVAHANATATVGTATPGANRSLFLYGGTCTVGRFTNSSVVIIGPAAGAGGATVILGAGPHSIASIAEGHADNVGNALTIGGRVLLSGTFTGTGIAVTPTGEGQVDCGGVGKVTAVTSTGRRLIVRSAVHSTTGIPLRGWQDDSCVNVMFKGRKVIGEPGVQ